ncbi:MAG: hypothetical protein AAFP26_06350 [Planctomycetota bacterium]
MPAARSRTERWRDYLDRIRERGGGIELTLDKGDDSGAAADLVWRARVVENTDDHIVIEHPATLGRRIDFAKGVALIGILSVGQNRWMFHTSVRGAGRRNIRGNDVGVLILEAPRGVERCRRRTFDRISTATVNRPSVDVFPLLDPRSAIPAEVACRVRMLDSEDSVLTGPATSDDLLPEVGPAFQATLSNIGGGGIGITVERDQAGSLAGHRVFWIRMNLAPTLPAPLSLTARLAHTHLDSEQRAHAGLSFDFDLHTAHREFVVEQIAKYMRRLQSGGTHRDAA